MSKKKHIDPIPDEFASYEEAAESWETHDTTDYPDAFRTVKAITKLRQRYYEVEIDEDIIKTLQTKAHQKGVTVSHLANDLIRQQIEISK